MLRACTLLAEDQCYVSLPSATASAVYLEHWQGEWTHKILHSRIHNSVQVLVHLQQERQDTTPERLYTGKLCQDETAQATQDLSSYTRASAVKKAFDTFPEIAGTLPIALKVVAKVVAAAISLLVVTLIPAAACTAHVHGCKLCTSDMQDKARCEEHAGAPLSAGCSPPPPPLPKSSPPKLSLPRSLSWPPLVPGEAWSAAPGGGAAAPPPVWPPAHAQHASSQTAHHPGQHSSASQGDC